MLPQPERGYLKKTINSLQESCINEICFHNFAQQFKKIKYWGLSNFDAEKTKAVLHFCDANQKPRPVANQPAYSLLNRGIEKDLLPLCKKNNLSVFPYQVLQGGVLTGKYSDTERPPKRSRADLKPEWLPQLNNKQMLEQLKILVKQEVLIQQRKKINLKVYW